MAESAVNTLLGNLTTILGNEVRLVSSVHSEVQFIKDEMESMYGFLLDSEEEHRRDSVPPAHQVRAWTNQVKELAYRSQECVDRYVTSVVTGPRVDNLMGYIIHLPIHVFKTLPERRRIASQIQELRVRVEDVGQRRQRYGVEIPSRAAAAASSGTDNKKLSLEEISPELAVGECATASSEVRENDVRGILVSDIPARLFPPYPFHTKENIVRVSEQLMKGVKEEEQHRWRQQRKQREEQLRQQQEKQGRQQQEQQQEQRGQKQEQHREQQRQEEQQHEHQLDRESQPQPQQEQEEKEEPSRQPHPQLPQQEEEEERSLEEEEESQQPDPHRQYEQEEGQGQQSDSEPDMEQEEVQPETYPQQREEEQQQQQQANPPPPQEEVEPLPYQEHQQEEQPRQPHSEAQQEQRQLPAQQQWQLPAQTTKEQEMQPEQQSQPQTDQPWQHRLQSPQVHESQRSQGPQEPQKQLSQGPQETQKQQSQQSQWQPTQQEQWQSLGPQQWQSQQDQPSQQQQQQLQQQLEQLQQLQQEQWQPLGPPVPLGTQQQQGQQGSQFPQQQAQPQQQSYKVFLTISSAEMHFRELADAIIRRGEHYSVMEWFHYISYVSMPVQLESTEIFTNQILNDMWCSQCKEPNQTITHKANCLRGSKLLLFVQGLTCNEMWTWLLQLLNWCGCGEGSAIVLVDPAGNSLGLRMYTEYELILPNPMIPYYLEKARSLLQDYQDEQVTNLVMHIVDRLCPHDFSNGWGLKMFMHFLYAKPTCTKEDLSKLARELTLQFTNANVQRVILACYDELSSHHKSCLMYLTTFQDSQNGSPIKRKRATWQWVFHGVIGDKDDTSVTALQEADRCFDTLVRRGFISPNISQGKVKTFETPNLIMDFLLHLRSTAGDSSCDKWWHHNKIRAITNYYSPPDAKSGCFHACAPGWLTCPCLDRGRFHTRELVRELLASPRISGVEVLDLQGCRGLKKRHLKRICTVMIFLKYLSIRNTDFEELPSVIEKLNYLEMLDIRQTNVRVFTSRVIKVKRLKHLLAGNKDSNGEVSTLSLPATIGLMSNLEVLSHIQVPKSNIDGMLQLHSLRLRKLGVVIHGKDDFKAFLNAISELCSTLQSLSVRIEEAFDSMDASEDKLFKSPVNLQRLSIRGIKHGLPTWVPGLHQLEKVTLQETCLRESVFKILGELRRLRKLKINSNSFTDGFQLTFAEEQFKSLQFLSINCPRIVDIKFIAGAAPKVQYIIWQYTELKSISGVEHLPVVKEFKLKGYSSNIDQAARNYIDNCAKKSVFDICW